MSIEERIKSPHKQIDKSDIERISKSWNSRPSLLTGQTREDFLRKLNIPLNKYYAAVEGSYILPNKEGFFDDILWEDNHEYQESDLHEATFSLAITPYINWLSQHIKSFIEQNDFSWNCSVEDTAIEFEKKELTNIAVKSVIDYYYDHFKNIHIQNYLINIFTNRNQRLTFFKNYPVLSRILNERCKMFFQNICIVLSQINKSKNTLEDRLLKNSLNSVYLRKILGDSHMDGKQVYEFAFNESHIIYFKFKDLSLLNAFEKFDQIISTNLNLDYGTSIRIITEDGSFEEQIKHSEVKTSFEARQYYTNFGKLLAEIYLLCGTDFHFENIMTSGVAPRVIDSEALFNVDSYMPNNNYDWMCDSVLKTNLLPVNEISQKYGVDISGINGGSKSTTTMQYSIKNNEIIKYKVTTKNANHNRLLLHGNPVPPSKYLTNILDGFKRVSYFCLQNKSFVSQQIRTLFDNLQFRYLIKNTQNYEEMLQYSLHPSCMHDYAERARLFENMWVGTKNYQLKYSEYLTLLKHDIPFFTGNTKSTSINTNVNGKVKGVFSNVPLKSVIERISRLTSGQIRFQEIIIKASIGWNAPNIKQNDRVTGPYLVTDDQKISNQDQLLQSIDNYITKYLMIDRNGNYNLPIFENVMNEDQIQLNTLGLYSGLNGIAVYLYYRSKITGKGHDLFQKIYSSIENIGASYIHNKVQINPKFIIGHLYSLQLLRGELSNKWTTIFDQTLDRLYQDRKKYKLSTEYLFGKSSLVVVLLNQFKITSNPKYLKMAMHCYEEMDFDQLQIAGFAHGYSGAIFALSKLFQSITSVQVKKSLITVITELIQKEDSLLVSSNGWKDVRAGVNQEITDYWCSGSQGVLLSRLQLERLNIHSISRICQRDILIAKKRVVNFKTDNWSLCHGMAGRNILLSKIGIPDDTHPVGTDFEINKLVNLGLFDGITGVGLSELFRYTNEIPDILGFGVE